MSEPKGMTVFNTSSIDTTKQPMFFGAPLGVQRYDSYKYPVFEKMTQQRLGENKQRGIERLGERKRVSE